MPIAPAPPSLGIGLIGVGHHGLRYARHLLSDVPGAHLAALCRRRPDAPLGLDLPASVPVHADPRQLVADPRVGAVVVVVPPALTPAICEAAVQARKPLLVEKPLAVTAPDARRMASAASRAGVLLMTAQTLRFDPTILALKDALPDAGTPRHLSITIRIPSKPRDPAHASGYGHRGALLEVGVHALDLVRFLTGEEVVEARCQTDHLPPTPETLATATLRTTSGLFCLVEAARVTAGRTGRAEWIGTHGQLTADWYQSTLTSVTAATGATPATPAAPEFATSRAIPPRPTVLSALTAFITAIRAGTPPPITGEDGFRAVELAEACYRSAAAAGQPVSLPLDLR